MRPAPAIRGGSPDGRRFPSEDRKQVGMRQYLPRAAGGLALALFLFLTGCGDSRLENKAPSGMIELPKEGPATGGVQPAPTTKKPPSQTSQ
jgi:hypothetical protein